MTNLFINFNLNRQTDNPRFKSLTDQLIIIKKRYGDSIFPSIDENDGNALFEHFVNLFFPNGISGNYFISNTSLDKERFDITIRPNLIEKPRLSEELPKNITLCARGHLFPDDLISPYLTIDRINDITNTELKAFEIDSEVTNYNADTNNKFSPNRFNENIFSAEYLTDLPEISKATKEKLVNWIEYLDWRTEYVNQRLFGVRYLQCRCVDDKLVFTFVAKDKGSFNTIKKLSNREKLMAVSLDSSTNEWEYNHNSDSRTRYYYFGEFNKIENTNYTLEDDVSIPFQKPEIHSISFQFNDANLEEYNSLDDKKEIEEFYDKLVKKYPENGFITVSVAGDMSLINRQKGLLNKLQLESGFAPFLSSWLFDIKKASTPSTEINIDNWLMDIINDDQKRAVKVMLDAPDIALMQGPPGTGKTTVIAEVIYQLAKQGKKVLLASQANLAVDNALERLASTPEIRAIRLGKSTKISEDGQQFVEDQVLKNFYSSISKACSNENSYLYQWQKCDEMLSKLNDWKKDLEFVQGDIKSTQKDIEKSENEIKQVDVKIKQEEVEQNNIINKNLINEELSQNLTKAIAFIEKNEDTDFTLPVYLLEFIGKNIILPINKLENDKIVVNKYWRLNDPSLSANDKTEFFIDVIKSFKSDIVDNLVLIESDLSSLNNSGNTIDAKTQKQIDDLKKQIKQLESELEEDDSKIDEWRDCKKEIKILEKKSGLNLELYSKIFTKELAGKPYYKIINEQLLLDSNKVTEFLSKAVINIKTISNQIETNLKSLVITINKKLKAITSLKADESLLNKLIAQKARINNTLKDLSEKNNSKQNIVESIIKEYKKLFEQKNQDIIKSINLDIKEHKETIIRDKSVRNDVEDLLKDWVSQLNNKEVLANDNEYYLDTYINNCNVIGVSCNENPRTLEDKNHVNFDVAIIDEVSKATPPELLMSMMLAKKTILVGDHRQLPPVFTGQENTMQELIDQKVETENNNEDESEKSLLTMDNFDRFKKMVTASLFKEYFEEAPHEIKQAVMTQYRMHPDIMNVINHFYEGKLKSGIVNPDKVKAHNLILKSPKGLKFIESNKHAIWIDTSKDINNKYFQEVQYLTGKINPLEVLLISELLIKMDNEYRQMGFSGENKKDVGVISFYGHQVGLLKKVIPHETFTSIKVDINSVDNFQGKEKSIIIASLVRNKKLPNKWKNTGHVAQFERINVAFSRAKELLVIFGAKDMFHDIEVTLPNMDKPGEHKSPVYRNIISDLNNKGCYFDGTRILDDNRYRMVFNDSKHLWENIPGAKKKKINSKPKGKKKYDNYQGRR